MAKTKKKVRAKKKPSKKTTSPKARKTAGTKELSPELKTQGVASESKVSETKVGESKKALPPPPRPTLCPKTSFEKKGEIQPQWKLIDASGQTLGRLCTQIATILMGKNRPDYTRHAALGDYVVVINAEKIRLTGKKLTDKIYYWHTGYMNGIKSISAGKLLQTHPERLIEKGVHGMLPRNHVGRIWRKRLRIFVGAEHDHKAQKPEAVTLHKRGAEV